MRVFALVALRFTGLNIFEMFHDCSTKMGKFKRVKFNGYITFKNILILVKQFKLAAIIPA